VALSIDGRYPDQAERRLDSNRVFLKRVGGVRRYSKSRLPAKLANEVWFHRCRVIKAAESRRFAGETEEMGSEYETTSENTVGLVWGKERGS